LTLAKLKTKSGYLLLIKMSGVRVYYDWFAGTLSNLLAAGIMDDVDPGLTIGWKDGKQITEKKEGK
jgi:hypothetical protein